MHLEEVCTAVRTELSSFAELKVFRVVPRGTTGNCMSSRWVLRWKAEAAPGVLMLLKARLTVRGFLDKDQGISTFAGTASRWGQRLPRPTYRPF